MDAIRSTAGNRIDYATRGVPVFSVEITGDYLKLLNCVLRNVVCSGASGIFVIELVRRIYTVGQERVSGRIATKRYQPEGSIGRNARREQNEAIHPATVDRKVLDFRVPTTCETSVLFPSTTGTSAVTSTFVIELET